MMKFFVALCLVFACIAPSQAQFLKKLKNKVNKAVDNSVNKTAATNGSATKQKEDAAASEYSDATENNERPIFAEAAPANGKMVLKLKKDDRFWGSYVRLKGQPKSGDANANILDYADARILAFNPIGEMSQYYLYIDGKRTKNDSFAVAVRPQFREYPMNKSQFFTGTDVKVNPATGFGTTAADAEKIINASGYANMSQADLEKMAKNAQEMAEKMKDMTPEQQAAYAMKNAKVPTAQQQKDLKKIAADSKNRTEATVTQGTFAFENNGKKYGPFTGAGINMLIFRPMEFGVPADKFYGLGAEPFIGEKQAGYHAVIQSEEKLMRVNDYTLGGLFEPTYPTGAMVLVQGKAFNFSNGTTMQIPANPPYMGGEPVLNVLQYGTDGGHIVSIPSTMQQVSDGGAKTAWVDYKIKLTYPLPIDKEHLLIATDPAKSVYYKNHIVYYPDGRQDVLDNVGDAQLCNFNGKDYLLWFEVTKIKNGHEIYLCQKELN